MFDHNDVEGQPGSPRLSAVARADLQCSILHSTERLRSQQLFVRFETKREFRDWLKSIEVTNEANRGLNGSDVNLLFTHAGLDKLGISKQRLYGMDEAFRRGTRSAETLAKLHDPFPDAWPGHEQPWDAALLLHCNTDTVLVDVPNTRSVLEFGNSLDANGRPIPTSASPGVARFNIYGYVDGISVNYYEAPAPDFQTYDPRYKLSTLLTSDPCSAQPGRFGSYFVFRKYQQDLPAFERRIEAIAHAIEQRALTPGKRMPFAERFPLFQGVSGEPLRDLVKAWLMGRRPSGETLSGHSGNDFDFASDPDGTRCPFHAHIAKVNPRGRTGRIEEERSRAIARRGISYGHRDSEPAGLLFWCAQASISRQFEYIQQHWANDSQVDVTLRPTPDLDNVVGKRVDAGAFERVTDDYPDIPRYDRWKDTIDIDFGVYDTITLTGSEYFFAPSLSGIAALKGAP